MTVKTKKARFLSAILCLALALGLLAGCGEAEPTDDTAASDAPTSDAPASEAPEGDGTFTTIVEGKLTMSTNAQFPPYELVSDGEGYEGTGFEGIDVELAYALAQKLGLELQIDDMDFDAALLAVQQGKSDMVMAGVTVTDERQNVMDFTDSYATGIQSIIVKEDSDIASVDDLAGKKIGTQRGTTGYLYCSDDFGDENVVAYDDGLTAVQMLNNGQVDCVVIDNAPAKEFIAANPGLKLLDTAYVEESYAIGIGKGNTELKDAINTALEELKADGTLQAIVDKYITAE